MASVQGIRRLIEISTRWMVSEMRSMIEWFGVGSIEAGAGAPPTVTLADGDTATVIEPYGLASHAPGGEALALAPGGDGDNLTAFVSSVAGRPSTDVGDTAVWTAAGHVVTLDDDGSLTIAGKDGASIELPNDGGVTITAAALGDINILVSDGQTINLGALAVALLRAQATQDHLVSAALYATQPGNFAPQDGGVLAFTNFGAFLAGTAIVPPAIPGNDLVNAAATVKARGF